MKFISKNIKKMKDVFKRGIAAFSIGATILGVASLTSCTSKEASQDSIPTETVDIDPNYVPGASDEMNAPVVIEQPVVEQTVALTPETYTYTADMWEAFVNESWNSIQGVINNADMDTFRSALTVFNIETLDNQNPQILVDYYSKGMDVENELNRAYSVLSQIREYNTTSENVYSVSNLLSSQKDRVIINVLEGYLREIKSETTSPERVREIFNTVSNFAQGTGRIAVIIGNDIVEVAQIDMSKGAVMLSENIMQSISVECQNIISEEERATLDNSLRMQDVLAGVQEIMIRNNAVASVTTQQATVEGTAAIYEQVQAQLNAVTNEVAAIEVTPEEAKALFTVANIDYFMSTADTQNAFKQMYSEGIDLNNVFAQAESAVEKIELFNLRVEPGYYDYGHFFIDSKTDIISISGLCSAVNQIHSVDPDASRQAVEFLKGYTQYSSLTTIDYAEYDEYNNLGTNVSLDKNALSKGANQLADWITYYCLINNRTIINNDQLINDMLPLVDGTTYGFTPFNDIVLMVTDYCAENNVTMFDYTVGQNQYTIQ